MNFNEYQKLARQTAIYPKEYSIIYPALGLAGETGEVCEKIKKVLRDKEGEFLSKTFREDVIRECGDIFWYLANLAYDLEIDLDIIAQTNIAKLQDRQNRGTLKGSGDNR